MRRSKFGNGVTIQDQTDLYGGHRPVRFGAGGKRDSPVLDSQELRQYAEMPEVETRTGMSYRSTMKGDDRTKNDDRVVSSHLEATSRRTINHLRETIATGETVQGLPPRTVQSFKLRSRNAKTSKSVQIPQQDDLEILVNTMAAIQARDPRKRTGDRQVPEQHTRPDVEARGATPSYKKDTPVELHAVQTEQIDVQSDSRPNQILREKQVSRPGLTSSGFDGSLLVSLAIPRLNVLSSKVMKTQGVRFAATENLPELNTTGHGQTLKEREVRTIVPRHDQDYGETNDLNLVRNRVVSRNSRKNKIATKLRSDRFVDDVRIGGFTKEMKDFGKQKPTREFSISKDEVEVSTRHGKTAPKRRENTKARSVNDHDRSEISSRSTDVAHTKKSTTTFQQKSDVDRNEVSSRPNEKLRQKATMESHRESDVDRVEVSSRPNNKLRQKDLVESHRESDVDRSEVSSRPNEKLRQKDTTSTHSAQSERDQEVETRSSTPGKKEGGKKKTQSSASVNEQDVTIASKPSSRGKGKKKTGTRTVRLTDAERPEISYVKYDPASKIIETKSKQNASHPIEGRREESVEVRTAPSSDKKKHQRNKIVAVPSIVEGEDSATSEPVLHDPMQSRTRQESVSREISAGIDSDDRTEIPKIKITFD